jgi:hypothetical protein
MPWATDLLPPEIDANMDRLETLWAQRGPHAAFVGYFIPDPWHEAKDWLQARGITLTACGGYGLKNVSVEENMKRIQSSRIAPALQSREQVDRGYLPCRILKNISYGALGISNNPAVERLFGPDLFSKLIVGTGIGDTLSKGLDATLDPAAQRQLMAHIRDNHTYVNRLQEVESVLVHCGYDCAPAARKQGPNVLHITFHAGCEADLQTVATELGWNLRSIMLLREPDASNEWYTMTDSVVSMLRTRFQAAIDAADVVIVSDTAPLARLFVDRPVKRLIVWVCNRINYECSVASYRQEVKTLSREPWVRYLAYTPFELEFAQRHGFDVQWHGTIRPVGRAYDASDDDHGKQVFVGAYHNDAIALDLRQMISGHVAAAGLTIAPQTRYKGPAELKTFAAIVHIPYSASNLALFEAVANEIPYLIPSESLMQRMMDGRERLPLKESLFVPDSKASSIEWYRFKDCVLEFDRFEDIATLLQPNCLADCKRRMRDKYPVHKEHTLGLWAQHVQDADAFAAMGPLLRAGLKPYVGDDLFRKWFHRVPQSREQTFGEVIRSLRKLNRPPLILELGTTRSFVDGRFPGCNSNDTRFWEPHVMDRWDWSAGIFTKVMATVFPDAEITTVDLARDHLERCRTVVSSRNVQFIHESSTRFLSRVQQTYDLIYLDTGDMTPIQPTAELQLAEAVEIPRILHPNGILLLDDVRSTVPMEAGCTHSLGKAYLSLPWLVDHGFYVCMDEYQTLLRRRRS